MITKWTYTQRHRYTPAVKEYIKNNNLRAIDVGASVYNWSYPECKTAIDLTLGGPINTPDLQLFNINLDRPEEWTPVLNHVQEHGKFDFSICSHTLEDLMFPFETLKLLTMISNEGYIAIPSKFEEFRRNGHPYRGYMHHKQFFDVIGDKLCLFPKLVFAEHDTRADEVEKRWESEYEDLVVYWADSIPTTYFGEGVVYLSDDYLSNEYFNLVNHTQPEDRYGV